jgi:hypothetical protein
MSDIHPEQNAEPKPVSPQAGKAVVMGVLVVAVAAASFALYWNMARGRRALAFWGADNVRLIQTAQDIELLTLTPAEADRLDDQGEKLEYGSQTWLISKRTKLAPRTPGFLHARTALTVDASFEPGEASPSPAGSWLHAIRFSEGSRSVLILMDFANRRFALQQSQREIKVIPKIADGWKSFVERQK